MVQFAGSGDVLGPPVPKSVASPGVNPGTSAWRQRLSAAGSQAVQGTAADDPGMRQVFMGQYGLQIRDARPGMKPRSEPLTTNRGAKDQIWSETFDVNKWRTYLIEIGALDEDEASYVELRKWWEEAVDEATEWYSRGRKVDPYQAAAILAGSDPAGPNDKTGRGTTAGQRKRMVDETLRSRNISKSVNLTDPESAKAVINAALSKYIGREATDEEIDAFTATLNQRERANPSVTTTDTATVYDKDGIPTSTTNSSTTQGGVSADGVNELAKGQARALPDYARYQAMATYGPLILQSLGALA